MNEIRVFMPHSIRGRGHPYWRVTGSRTARSTIELVITAVPFVILWILMWGALGSRYWVGLLLAVPAAGFLVRLFMIQHDCGHGSFFRRRLTNDWVGRVIGALTLGGRGCVARNRRASEAAVGVEHAALYSVDPLRTARRQSNLREA